MANHASSLPSPASANSSSTLIVTLLPMSLKQDVLGSHTVHNMNSDLTTASDDEGDICASKPLDVPGEPLPAPQTLPSSQVLPESQSGGLMFPSIRSAGQLGKRLPSGASSQTRMSERGFVEPHHSNVPRRSRTRVKTKMTVDAANPESKERVQDASRSPTSPAHAHAPSSPPVPPPLSISEEPKPILIPAPPIPLLTPSLNPHSARMPDQLLSLRLPTTPPPPPVPQIPGGLPPSSSVPHAPLSGLPQGIGLGFSTPISTPGFGVGMQPTTQRITTPATIGGTPGSGRLPKRRRRVAAGSPTPVGRVPFQGLKSSALGMEGDLAFGNTPTIAQELESDPVPATAPVATTPPPPVVPADTPHGPPTYPAHIRTLQVFARQKREEARAERRRKRVRMGIQRVGKDAGVEVGFLDSELKNEREVEDRVDADGEIKGAYVLLHVADSDSDSSDDDDSEDEDIGSPLRRTLSSRAFSKPRSRSAHVRSVAAPSEPSASASTPKDHTTQPGRSHSVRERKNRERERPARAELKLSLPTDRRAFVDGSCALSTAQVWEACTFVKGILEDTGEGERKWKDRVRILAPRGRPEDAMGVAIAYLAYGRAAVVTSTPAGPSGPSTLTSTSVQTASAARLLVQTVTSMAAGDEKSIGRVGCWSRRGSMAVPGDMFDVVVDIEGGSPSAVEVEVQLGNDDSATSTTTTEPEATHTSTIDDSAEISVDIIFHPNPDPEIAYAAAHTLTMALLDEGDWLSRGTLAASGTTTAAAMSNTTTQGEHLGAGRGIVGVVDMEHPRRGGLALGLGMLDGEEEEDDNEDDNDEEWDEDEERSGQSDDGEDDDEEDGDEDVLSSSAGARVDSHSGSEALPPPPTDAYIPLDSTVIPSGTPADAIRDADGDEDEDNDDGRRRGRTVTWHGVPMPPKFVEQSPSTSLSRPPPPIRHSAKSKSKSRVRGRARSQVPMLGSTREGDEDRNDEGAANDNEDDRGREQESRARSRRRMSRAREARREERRRARKREREAEKEYFGIGDAWRGVLSFEGLSGIGEMMRGWGGVVEG